MKTHKQTEPSDIHTGTVAALVAYLRDCKMTATEIVPMNLALALEYVYQPETRFWRELNISLVTDALELHLPNWRDAVNQVTADAAEGLVKEIDDLLRMHAFDESNAERLLAVEEDERPSDAVSASGWIRDELTRLNMHDDAAYVARDGYRCGEAALEIIYCLKQASKGLPGERLGKSVAGFYRRAVMNDTNRSTVAKESNVLHSTNCEFDVDGVESRRD
jgi:hypothetical protein